MKRILEGLLLGVIILCSSGLQATEYITSIEAIEPGADVTLVAYKDPLHIPRYKTFDSQTSAKASHVYIHERGTVITLNSELVIPFESTDRISVIDHREGTAYTFTPDQIRVFDPTNTSGRWHLVIAVGGAGFRKPDDA